MNRSILKRTLFLLFSGLCIFLTFNRHSHSGYYNYHSEIWSDKAGYYVYLPATFIYDFEADKFPDSTLEKTGYGFRFQNNKIINKYTSGVAILQSPFFLSAHISAPLFNYEANGFTPIYNWCINLASVFYLLAGLLLLRKFLLNHFPETLVYITLLSVFLGSGLYYYSIDETGMSHVYSFFLFASFLFILDKVNYQIGLNFHTILLGMITGIILLIRPTNLIFIFTAFLLNCNNLNDIRIRIRSFFNLPALLLFCSFCFIVFIPQFFYWKYSSGSFINYSYGNETFSNWSDPELLKVWFGAGNSLFSYSPLYFFIILGCAAMIFKKLYNGIVFAILFLVLSWMIASWWDWGFGCAFGSRNFVEYSAIFSFPLAFLIQKIFNRQLIYRYIFISMIFLCAIINLKLTYTYDGCSYAKSDWDWNNYNRLIFSAPK